MISDPLPYPYGSASLAGRIKTTTADFRVFEELGFEPCGEGEHLFLQVEKNGLGTAELATRLAREHAIHPRDISYCGLKDKHAIATQWLSLHLPGKRHVDRFPDGDGYHILRAVRHRSRLRRGIHAANSFRVLLRGIDDLGETAQSQLRAIREAGMANYFGAQRFGRRADNVAQALQRLNGARLKRQQRGMLISSLRSFLFNRILASRIERGDWDLPVEGDAFMLRGSHSYFSAEIDDEVLRRFEIFDISPCGSLYGKGQCPLQGRALAIEQEIFAEHAEIADCLIRAGASLQLRPLRIAVEDFGFEHDPVDKTLEIRARLPAGCYMTSLLEHFVDAEDASQADLR